MTKADKAIKDKFPNATPHDLLTMHGMSEQGFNEIVAEMDVQAQQAQTFKPIPVLKPANILQPQRIIPVLSSTEYVNPNEGKVLLVPPGGGTGTWINKRDAEKAVKHNPKYKIKYHE